MSTQLIHKVLSEKNPQKKLTPFSVGDTVGIYMKVKEGSKERIQQFKGVVLKIQGRGSSRSFTVRKISEGIGVEKTVPFSSPLIDNVKLYSRSKVRRSRIYYLRKRKGKSARLEAIQDEAPKKD